MALRCGEWCTGQMKIAFLPSVRTVYTPGLLKKRWGIIVKPQFMEPLERRVQLSSGIQYGFDVSGDPSVTSVLNATGPGLKDLGAKGVRLFTNVSFLPSDFGT